ncbi:MAG TPA: RcpC/CpaB family pilus assembly protein [Symbiobacteriaceae bacterium]|nr:RcpC/CpaB family pilus assembly protein [Symbiobacteriaceae bacterium]
MQRSRLPLTLALLTFVIALVAGLWVYQRYLKTVPVLVPTQDIAAGAEIGAGQVRVVRVPAGQRPLQALWGPGQAVGKRAAVPLFVDQFLSERHVTNAALPFTPGGTPPDGKRLIALPVKAAGALGGALKPGDLVEVAAAWSGPEGRPGPVSVLASGIPVVEVRISGPESAGSYTVLLLATPEQAKALVGAVESNASIWCWLVGRGAS